MTKPRKFRIIVPVFLFAALPIMATAQVCSVIDQSSTDASTRNATFSQVDVAQSFIPAASQIEGASAFIHNSNSGSGSVTLELWTDLPDEVGATKLAEGSNSFPAVNQWVNVAWSPVAVTPGTTYYLVYFGLPDGQLAFGGSTENPYPSGIQYTNEGFNDFPGFDLAFRTCTQVIPELTPIPMLSQWGLILLVLLFTGTAVLVGKHRNLNTWGQSKNFR